MILGMFFNAFRVIFKYCAQLLDETAAVRRVLALSTPISHFLSGFDNCHRFSCPARCTTTSDDCLRESNLVISKHAHLAKGP